MARRLLTTRSVASPVPIPPNRNAAISRAMTVNDTSSLRPYRASRPRHMASFGRSVLPLVVLMLFAGSVVFASWFLIFLAGLGWNYVTGTV